MGLLTSVLAGFLGLPNERQTIVDRNGLYQGSVVRHGDGFDYIDRSGAYQGRATVNNGRATIVDRGGAYLGTVRGTGASPFRPTARVDTGDMGSTEVTGSTFFRARR